MKYRYLFLFGFIAISNQNLSAQTPFTTTQYVDANNINAATDVQGDLWVNALNNDSTVCQFPQGTDNTLFYRGSLWLSGYDANNNLHVSATIYREDGNDYWPGPLDNNDTCTYATSQNWAKIWKVNYSDIQAFLATSNHTVNNTPTAILQWPAKGNPYAVGNNNTSLTITEDMAPFVDVNSDGIYNPLDGDYPLMKGDQMLWWVYNDNGATHNGTNGTPLKVEIHATAYAYRRWTLIDNVVYYQYDIINKSQNTYSNFRIGHFADGNFYYPNNFLGYDSTWRMGINYPATTDHGGNGGGPVNNYSFPASIAGITFVHLPTDNGGNHTPLGSFIVFHNDFSYIGNPMQPSDFDNYMRMKYLNGNPYPDTTYWTDPLYECDSDGAPGAMRFIMSTGDMSFAPGETKTIVAALISTDTAAGLGCPNITMDNIDIVADTAWAVYNNPPPPNAVTGIQALSSTINIYPNPATDVLYVAYSGLTNAQIVVTDITGRTLLTKNLPGQNGSVQINLQGFAPGMYLYRVIDNDMVKQQGKFVKE